MPTVVYHCELFQETSYGTFLGDRDREQRLHQRMELAQIIDEASANIQGVSFWVHIESC